jgi:hypothetical protein
MRKIRLADFLPESSVPIRVLPSKFDLVLIPHPSRVSDTINNLQENYPLEILYDVMADYIS